LLLRTRAGQIFPENCCTDTLALHPRPSRVRTARAHALAHLRICDNNQELNGRLNPGAIVGATGQREVKTMDVLSKAREKVPRARPHMLTRTRACTHAIRVLIAQRRNGICKIQVHREKTDLQTNKCMKRRKIKIKGGKGASSTARTPISRKESARS
jgi:hypothetical protein